MVETKRETFTVLTTGSGQPDYSQPTLAPTALTVQYPVREDAGKKYNDSISQAFTATQVEYVIGTNAIANRAGTWPTNTICKEEQFYTEEGCYIRFNEADAQPNYIPALLALRFFSRITKIYVYRASTNGTLLGWFEG